MPIGLITEQEQIRQIRPSKGWTALNIKDLLHYRELLYFLTWRDIKVRYKQTVIGATWAILQPLLTMIIFTIFFGRIAKVPSEGIAYPIFSFSGLILWIYFSTAVTNAGNSLVGSSNLITKVYFPRLIIPLSASLAGIIDYFISLGLLLIMMIFYKCVPNYSILLLPVIVFFALFSATGMGLWFSALNVKYRDVRYAIPFLIQLLLFATPVIYPVTIFPQKYRLILFLNPIAGVIDAHRACLLGYKAIDWLSLCISLCAGILIFVSGLYYFSRTERFFADII